MFTYLKLAAYAAVAAFLIGSTAYLTHAVDQNKYDKREAQWVAAKQKAIDDAVAIKDKQDKDVLASALASAAAQIKIETQTITVIQKVPQYVKVDSIGCITYGFIRVLDAIPNDTDASNLPLPPGKSNDSCTGYTAIDVAQWIARNYGNAHADARQLNDLEATVRTLLADAQPAQ